MNERSRDCFHSGNEESRHPVLICVPTPMLVLTVMLMSGLMWPLREVQCSAQSGVSSLRIGEHLHSSHCHFLSPVPSRFCVGAALSVLGAAEGEEWCAEVEHLELSLGTVQWRPQDRTHPGNSGHGGQPAVLPWEQGGHCIGKTRESGSEFCTGPQVVALGPF